MAWVVCLLVGIVVGGGLSLFVMFLFIEASKARFKEAMATRAEAERQVERAREKEAAAVKHELGTEAWAKETLAKLTQGEADLQKRRAAFDDRVIRFDELVAENGLLKRDLQNMDVALNKSVLDHQLSSQNQRHIDEKAGDLAKRYIKDVTKWSMSSLTVNNYGMVKEKLLDTIERCRSIGYSITKDEEYEALAHLKAEYERLVKAAVEREEQARIKAQIREEARLQREAEEELERAARERTLIERALAEALARSNDQHTAEIEVLRTQLAEAEAKSQRAISMAQQTKAGNVYVISNIGSFGEGVFKVGMTRRLEPKDRVKELGDASVPFPFDIHMMISCEDAPALENALHKRLHRSRINRVNPRKEFFRTGIDAIVRIVKEHRGEVQYVADPEALEFRQSQTISEEDSEFIEKAYERAEVATGMIGEAE